MELNVKMNMAKLPQRKRDAIELIKAQGSLALLAIGISNYSRKSGFHPLSTCSNDALAIRDVFLDTWQLNINKSKVQVITSDSSTYPSKGQILSHTKELAESADPDDRILFYFSGHGHRIDDRFYLVPEDAYTDDDPDALINFAKITDILERAIAKQKVIILDACLSGPLSGKTKLVAEKYSKKYLKEYFKNTKGIAVLSSSSMDEASYIKSPNPKLSLFTHYLVKAFQGDPEALDESGFLTISSLYDFLSVKVSRRAKSYQKAQKPCLDVKSTGTLVFGDFTQSIISPSSFSLGEFPLSSLLIEATESFYVDYVLTNIKSWSNYSEDYLEERVNDNLDKHLEESLGIKAANLRREFDFQLSAVGVEGCELLFPNGALNYYYKAEGKKYGQLIGSLSLEKEWLKLSEKIPKLIDVLGITVKEITFNLSKRINPNEMVSGFESKGWKIDSVLSHKVEASYGRFKIKAKEDALTFSGITIEDLLGLRDISEKTELTYNTFALLGS
jgi:hypothetical protein